MLVLRGRVPTRVPERPRQPTALPSARVSTPVPESIRHATPLPGPRAVDTVVPSAPHIPTRRPPTKNRLIAQGSAAVTGSAAVHARLGVEYAENGMLVEGIATVVIGGRASNTTEVSGTAAVRVRHEVAATGSAAVAATAVARARYTRNATQAVDTGDTVASIRATYRLAAAQSVTIDSTVVARPIIAIDAGQSVDVANVASSVPSVGTVSVDAAQSIEASGAAAVRLRHILTATQDVAVSESATRDAIVIPGAGAQTIAVEGAATTRARYSLAASQTVAVAGAARGAPALNAANAVAVSGAATSRPRHTLYAASSAAVSSAATADIVTIKRQRVNLVSEVPNPAANGAWGDIANWASDPAFPATVNANKKMVVVGNGNVNVTVPYRMNTVANTASTIRITVNGVAVATFPDRLQDGDYVDTATFPVVNGDVIDLQFKRTVAGSNSLQLPSSIDLAPA
ncbi:hypothetical protein SEA_SUERTE_28 [Gordonia phage Suerte]|uniref:Uncharacterized protein n=1 Tax=Gordonia phage Suerte TaxID=2652883 RepID=A0A5P8DDI4_9CAUD|nr:hypothetical protein PP511_gp28 [Gordonia phage Suerte]QFP97047.1 hypothetical protein SEA_SUERTE_28 [Gordonia phage Suerte]